LTAGENLGILRLPPFGSSAIRAVKKEQKHCHLDWKVSVSVRRRC